MAAIDVSKYIHSPAHKAVVLKDYESLKRILSALPNFRNLSEIITESDSILEEQKADTISAVIDCRDVPNRDTPLHLAVKLGDEAATDMLMAAGADWSLHNEHGWSALQEAICNREEKVAMIIVKHYQPLAWAKWCRRLPRLVGTMRRMRDFYMEITFNFESSVIPFISRIAPSDTYKIWKRGSNLRADMTLAGFDGLKIQRSDQSVLFLGDGTEDGLVPPGSLCMISHKKKEIINALDDAGVRASDAEVRQEVEAMSQSNIFRPGIDLTRAVLLPKLTWRRQEKAEAVGPWKAKVYEMHNVVVSIKSRTVPGVVTDEDEKPSSCQGNEFRTDELDELLTDDERRQLEVALKLDPSSLSNASFDGSLGHDLDEKVILIDEMNANGNAEDKQEKRSWFGGWKKKDSKLVSQRKNCPPRSSLCSDEKVSDLLNDLPCERQNRPGRRSAEILLRRGEQNGKDNKASTSEASEGGNRHKDCGRENEFRKGLRPILWLSPNFPLQIDELLPLLDILANKVKAIRRLRELLTTKLPAGTFPVKVAIPVIPTVRVLVTFTKFEELAPSDEFSTPPSSPPSSEHIIPSAVRSLGSSWLQWMKVSNHWPSSTNGGLATAFENANDPFAIPDGYAWATAETKKKKDKGKTRKGKEKTKANISS